MYSKILTINEIYSDNIGDQAIADAMLLALNNKADIIERADYSFRTDISYLLNIKVMERLRFIKTLIPSNLKKMMSLIIKFPYAYKFAKNKYDIAIIGGGQLILSNYSFAVSMFLWVTTLKLFGTKIKIKASIGDQPASLYGNGCLKKGDLKITLGTGGFLWLNKGNQFVPKSNTGCLETLAWSLKKTTFASEGFIFMAGALLDYFIENLNFAKDFNNFEKIIL